MNQQPTKAEWMAYLYGEANAEEQARLERWLADHPDARAQWQDWQQLRRGIQNSQPELSPAPALLTLPGQQRSWQTPALAVAATLLLLFLGTWMSGYRLTQEAPAVSQAEGGRDTVFMEVPAGTSPSDSLLGELLKRNEELLQQVNRLSTPKNLTGPVPLDTWDLAQAKWLQEQRALLQDWAVWQQDWGRDFSSQLALQLHRSQQAQREADLEALVLAVNSILAETGDRQDQTDQLLGQLIYHLQQQAP